MFFLSSNLASNTRGSVEAFQIKCRHLFGQAGVALHGLGDVGQHRVAPTVNVVGMRVQSGHHRMAVRRNIDDERLHVTVHLGTVTLQLLVERAPAVLLLVRDHHDLVHLLPLPDKLADGRSRIRAATGINLRRLGQNAVFARRLRIHDFRVEQPEQGVPAKHDPEAVYGKLGSPAVIT